MRSFVSQKRRWIAMYEAALSELDEHQRLDVIALASGAVLQRKQELTKSDVNFAELAALEDASYVLAGLRRAAEFNRKR